MIPILMKMNYRNVIKRICEIADTLDPRSYTSREFIYEMGKYLKKNSKKKDSLIETAYDNNVPIFCPAFTDSSAGFGLVTHQENNPEKPYYDRLY